MIAEFVPKSITAAGKIYKKFFIAVEEKGIM